VIGRSSSSLVRKAIKAAALPIGVPSRRREGDVVILAYHRVGAGSREIDLPCGTFARHLEALGHDDVLSLDDALAEDRGGVVLSFDDGYRDFHDNVLPMLSDRRFPATLYLATSLVVNGNGRAARDRLSWNMLREAVSTGLVSIGSHTHTHVDLSRAAYGEAEQEMRRSKSLIEDEVQVTCRHFAYQWGVASTGAEDAARDLFQSAALDSWRTNRRGRIDRHRLARTPVLRNDEGLFFRAKAMGMLDAERLAYRLLRRGPWKAPG
jgi:peptidoglycan/xylan/chitin deacetylase (PgdA/CDA1 family)